MTLGVGSWVAPSFFLNKVARTEFNLTHFYVPTVGNPGKHPKTEKCLWTNNADGMIRESVVGELISPTKDSS